MGYNNVDAGGYSVINMLSGLWKDRFTATAGGESIGHPHSLDESPAGYYTLKFDVSGMSPGTYTVELKVIDNLDYNSAVDSETVVIPNKPPTASFTYSPSDPFVGQSVNFDASESTDYFDGSVENYYWEFGGGSPLTSTSEKPTVTWYSPRTYSVTLKVQDDEGAWSSPVSGTVTVTDQPATGSILISPANPVKNQLVTFTYMLNILWIASSFRTRAT
jgi:PKD repeat protein